MNILNIHGYAGTAENTNYSILHDSGYKVISFAIDYDNCKASDVQAFLSAAVKVYKIEVIVATSYGSYFANILSAKYDIPFIATNPCVDPLTSLMSLSPDYCINEAQYFKNIEQEYATNWEKGVFILGDKDEVIDHSITKSVVGNAKTYVVSGTHKLNRENYEKLLIKEVTVFIRDMDSNQG